MPLSAKQMEYLALAWQCFESEPKIDYTKFATVAGLKTPASARELMRVTKNKLRDEYGALSSGLQSSNSSTSTPQTPSKRARATPAAATPASRKRARKEKIVDVDVDAEVGTRAGDDEAVSDKEAAHGAKGRDGGKENRAKGSGGVGIVKSEPEEAMQESEEEPSFF